MKLLLWFPWRPRRVAQELSNSAWPNGAGALAFSASIWCALCLWLSAGAHTPARVLVPIPAEHYYLAQAIFVAPLLFVQALVLSAVCAALARVPRARLMSGSATALASATFWGLLLPDVLVYGLAGFDGLRLAVRFTGPALAVLAWLLQARVLQATTKLGGYSVWGVSFLGLLAQALVGAPLLR